MTHPKKILINKGIISQNGEICKSKINLNIKISSEVSSRLNP